MKTAITLLLPLLLSAAVNVQAGTFVSHSRAIPDRYIVLFDSSVTRNDVDARVADIEARWKVVVDRRGGTRAVFKNAVRGFAGKLSIEAARAIAGEPGILLVEQTFH